MFKVHNYHSVQMMAEHEMCATSSRYLACEVISLVSVAGAWKPVHRSSTGFGAGEPIVNRGSKKRKVTPKVRSKSRHAGFDLKVLGVNANP